MGYVNNGEIHNVGIENVNIYSRGGLVDGFTSGSVGGLVGYALSSTISNCYTAGNVIGRYYVGGLVGYANGYITITNCYATGKVMGTSTAGGLGKVQSRYNKSLNELFIE